MEYQSDKKYLFLSDREYAPLLYRFKNSNPDLKMSVMTFREFYDKAAFSFDERVYPFLMKKGWDYSDIRKLLNILRVADLSKSKPLSDLYREIRDNGYLKKDPYGLYEIRQYENVFLLEAREDDELHGFLLRNGIHFEDISLEEDIVPCLDEVNSNFNPKDYPILEDGKKITADAPIETLLFPNRYIQYFHFFARIRAMILEDEKNKDTPLYQNLINRITILCKDESEVYYLSLFADIFDIPVMLKIRKAFLTYPEVKARIDEIYKKKSFVAEDKENQTDQELTFQSLIDKFDLASLPFDFGYSNLLEIISDHEVTEVLTTNGILCTNRLNFDPNLVYFVTCFEQGEFYQYHDDKNIYSDSELVYIGANPSYVLTALDRRKKLNFLRFNHIVCLSRVKQHLTDAIYDSQFIDEFQMKYVPAGFALDSGSYTNKAKELYHCYIKDENHLLPMEGDDYKSYRHAFTGIRKPIERKGKKKDTYGVTEIESYVKCPFAYYLDRFLCLSQGDPDDDKHARWLGTFSHHLFQYIFDDDFDFDRVYEEAKADYIAQIHKDEQEYGPYEEVIMTLTKHWFRKVMKLLREQCQGGNMNLDKNPVVEKTYENKVSYQLSDGNKTYSFNGQIDKLIYTIGSPSDHYYTIVDYKSGKEDFDYKVVFLGLSIQLPLYYYALSDGSNGNEKLTNYGRFGGFGIQHIYKNSPKGFFTNKDVKSLDSFYDLTRLKGITNNEEAYLASFDKTCFVTKTDGTKKVANGNYLSTKLSITTPDDCFTKVSYTFNEMIEDAKKAALDVLHHIDRNEFPIAPTATDAAAKNTNCKYCVYKDICYHDSKDTISLFPLIQKKFKEGKGLKTEQPVTDEEEGEED